MLLSGEGGLVVDAAAGEAFDSMLHRDARFWGEIAARKVCGRAAKPSQKLRVFFFFLGTTVQGVGTRATNNIIMYGGDGRFFSCGAPHVRISIPFTKLPQT